MKLKIIETKSDEKKTFFEIYYGAELLWCNCFFAKFRPKTSSQTRIILSILSQGKIRLNSFQLLTILYQSKPLEKPIKFYEGCNLLNFLLKM